MPPTDRSNSADWYTLDKDLTVQDRGTVSLGRALEIFDGVLSRLQPAYASGEEALAETMFGFSRGSGNFVELCVHTTDHVNCQIELPGPSRLGGSLFARRFEWNRDVRPDEARRLLSDFFDLSPEDLRRALEAR
jgi:hypothetical protein